jgi:sterol O-acyltransferase
LLLCVQNGAALTVLLLFGLNIAVTDYFEKGTFLDFSMLQSSFAGLSTAVYYWCLMFVGSFLIIPLAHMATISRGWLKLPWVALYAVAQLAVFTFSGWVVTRHGFAPPLAMGFMAEQTRISMKSHAYFREKLLWHRFGAASAPGSLFSMSYLMHEVQCFFYFLWVPTLVYREQYPRTNRIRWSFVITRVSLFPTCLRRELRRFMTLFVLDPGFQALECIGIVAYAFVLFRSITPQFEAGAKDPGTFKQIILLCFRCMAPGMALMFFTHFLVLHAVQNMFAELTRFADRKFYEGELF